MHRSQSSILRGRCVTANQVGVRSVGPSVASGSTQLTPTFLDILRCELTARNEEHALSARGLGTPRPSLSQVQNGVASFQKCTGGSM